MSPGLSGRQRPRGWGGSTRPRGAMMTPPAVIQHECSYYYCHNLHHDEAQAQRGNGDLQLPHLALQGDDSLVQRLVLVPKPGVRLCPLVELALVHSLVGLLCFLHALQKLAGGDGLLSCAHPVATG